MRHSWVFEKLQNTIVSFRELSWASRGILCLREWSELSALELFVIEFPPIFHSPGSIEEQEYYTDILLGIKQVIQCHLKDLQGRFQDKFVNLEMEVRRRDDIINQLQNRLREFEPGDRMTPINEKDHSGSSNELPFMVRLFTVVFDYLIHWGLLN